VRCGLAVKALILKFKTRKMALESAHHHLGLIYNQGSNNSLRTRVTQMNLVLDIQISSPMTNLSSPLQLCYL